MALSKLELSPISSPSLLEKHYLKPSGIWGILRESLPRKSPDILIFGTDKIAALPSLIYNDPEISDPFVGVIESEPDTINQARDFLKCKGYKAFFMESANIADLPPVSITNTFDLIYGQYIFSRFSGDAEKLKKFIDNSMKMLKPKGILALSIFKADSSDFERLVQKKASKFQKTEISWTRGDLYRLRKN